MTDLASPAPGHRPWVRSMVSGALALGIIAAALVAAPRFFDPADIGFRPHAPDWDLLAVAPLALQIHLGSALAAFALGLVQFIGPKGTGFHRVVGWAWVLLIATAAISSLFLRQLNHGAFSLIHILSGWTLVVLPMAVYAARRDVARHRGRMTGLFIGGLLIAGGLAFLPGRMMWRLFLGD